MQLKYIGPAIEALEQWRGFSWADVVPCTSAQLAALDANLPRPYRLPDAYRELLEVGGQKLVWLYGGVDISFEMVWALLSSGYRSIAGMLHRHDRDAVLPPEIFVLNEHLGSNFTYVKLTEGMDPPVYFWEEGDGALETSLRTYDAFSQFLLAEVQKSIRHRGG